MMTLENGLEIAALVVAVGGGVWGVVRWFAVRDRATIDKAFQEANDRIDEAKAHAEIEAEKIREELAQAKLDLVRAQRDLAVLKDRLDRMPDGEYLQAKLESLESKIERKIDGLASSLHASIKSMTDAMTAGVTAALQAHGSGR